MFEANWESVLINIETLGAISGGENGAIKSPDRAFGDTQTDYVTFEIPRFQRGLRWGEKKRKALLTSIQRGYPIGAIVLARRPDQTTGQSGHPTKKWYVLDGQQRIFATQELLNTFWIKERYDINPLIETIRGLSSVLPGEPGFETVKQAIIKAIADGNGPPNDSTPLLRSICQHPEIEPPIGDPSGEAKALEQCTDIRTALLAQFDGFRKFPVPALLVTPDLTASLTDQQSVLTEVFKRLNDFVKLQPYELIAATWASDLVDWEPELTDERPLVTWLFDQMQNRISNTYVNDSDDDEFDYDPNIEELTDANVNLFDLLFALSQSIGTDVKNENEAPTPRYVFKLGDSQSNIAFDVLNLFLQRSLNQSKMAQIPGLLPKKDADSNGVLRIDASQVIKAITESANVIQRVLAEELFPTPSAVPSKAKAVGQIQAAVYLSNYMALTRTHSDFSERTATIPMPSESNLSVTKAKSRWQRNLSAWWFRDILSEDFQGSSAYSNAAQRVWSGEEPVTAMCSSPKRLEIVEFLNRRFIGDSARLLEAPKRRRPNDAARAVMLVASKGVLASGRWQADHVVAYKSDPAHGVPELTSPIPLNHVANWMPLEASINQARGNTPWANFIDSLTASQKETIRKRLLLPAGEFTSSCTSNVENFLTVMLRRWILINHRIFSLFNLDQYDNIERGDQVELLAGRVVEPILEGLFEAGIELDRSRVEVEQLLQ